MSDLDYKALAELFAARGRGGLRYRRFSRPAEAIRYAIEKLPADVLSSARLEVEEQQYDYKQIRTLYESKSYQLTRKSPSP